MKQYNKTHCPDSIEYKGETYKLNIDATHSHREGVKMSSKYHIQVNVLSKNVKGKTDLHGNLYKPSAFIYSSPVGFLPTVVKPVETPAYKKAMKQIKKFGYGV